MTEELKPCPFCSGEAKVEKFIIYGRVKGYFVYCNHCEIQQGKNYKTRSNAIKAWNRRQGDE